MNPTQGKTVSGMVLGPNRLQWVHLQMLGEF